MRLNNYEDYPIKATLDLFCGSWKAVILQKLVGQTLRFGELDKQIPRISKNVLTKQLRELEQEGLVNRKVYAEIPAKVEYSLTSYGEETKPLLKMLHDWGKNHITKRGQEEKEEV